MPDMAVLRTGSRTLTNGGLFNRSIASLSGSAQLLIASNQLRKAFTIKNIGTAKITLSWFNATVVENTSGTLELEAGESVSSDRLTKYGCTPVMDIYVNGTAGQPVYAEEALSHGGVYA